MTGFRSRLGMILLVISMHLFDLVLVKGGTYGNNCDGEAVPLLNSEYEFLKALYESTNGPSWCFPTYAPTRSPSSSSSPTKLPTLDPTRASTFRPTRQPTYKPTTLHPTPSPTISFKPSTSSPIAPTPFPSASFKPTQSTIPTYSPTVLSGENPWDFSNNASNPCFFRGVSCDCEQTTQSIKKNFSFINHLALNDLCLTGTLPSFEGLNNSVIRYDFDFSNNKLSGTLPLSIAYISGVTGTLEFLHFSNNKLNGTLDPNFFNFGLRGLYLLELQHNSFHGSIPNTISQLSHIIQLSLANNQFSSTIPESISALTKLSSLDLSRNRFNGSLPSSIPKFALSSLHIAENLFTGIFSEIFYNNSLVSVLNASNNQFTGKLFLDFKCFSVDISNNRFSGTIPLILSTTTIHAIYASGNGLSGSIPNISQSVYILDLSYNSLTGHLPRLTPLMTNLNVQHNSLKGHLPTFNARMDSIDVSNNKFSGPLPYVEVVSSFEIILNSFNASNNKLSGSIPSSFFTSLTALSILDLSNNSFTGTLSDYISELSNLGVLYIPGNHFKGTIPSSITSLTNLRYLYLATNSFVGTIPTGLQTLSKLQCVWLYNNNFEGNPFKSFNFYTQYQLQIIDIGTNIFTGVFPKSLSNLKYMKAFISESNCFRDNLISDSFCSMGSLKLLSLDGFKSSKNCKNVEVGLKKYFPFAHGFISYNGYMSVPKCIFQISSLESLHLSGNFITGTIPDIATNSSLVDLSLADNYFSGQIPESIQRHQFIEKLNLGFNQLSGTLMPSFVVSDRQNSLILSNNRLSGDLPLSISKLNNKYDTHYLTSSITSTNDDYYVTDDSKSKINNIRVLDVLNGNMFSCSDHVPQLDSSHSTYSCASQELDRALGIYYLLFGGTLIIIFVTHVFSKYIPVSSLSLLNDEAGKNNDENSAESAVSNHSKDLSGCASLCAKCCYYIYNMILKCFKAVIAFFAFILRSIVDYFTTLLKRMVFNLKFAKSEINKWNKKASDAVSFCYYDPTDRSISSSIDHKDDSKNLKKLSISKGTKGDIPEIRSFLTCLNFVRKWSIGLLVYCLVTFLPLFSILSSAGFSIVFDSYTYFTSITFLHGMPVFTATLIFLVIVLIASYIMVICNHKLLYNYNITNSVTKDVFISNLHVFKSKYTMAQEYTVALFVILINAFFTIIVNVIYVGIILLNGKYIVLAQVTVGIYQMLWEKYYVGYISDDGLTKLVNKIFRIPRENQTNVSTALTMRIVFQLSIFNSIIAPVLATFFVDRSCFYYVFIQHNEVYSSCTFNICTEFAQNPLTKEITGCNVEREQFSESFYYPPFAYSYTCGASVLKSYIPIFIYSYCSCGLLIPLLTLIRNIFPNIFEALGEKVNTALYQFLQCITCTRQSLLNKNKLMSSTSDEINGDDTVSNESNQRSGQNDLNESSSVEIKTRSLNLEALVGKEQVGKIMIGLCMFFTFGIANPLLGIISVIYLVVMTSLNILLIGRSLCLISKDIDDKKSSIRNKVTSNDNEKGESANNDFKLVSSNSMNSSFEESPYIRELEKSLLYSWKGIKSCFKEMLFVITFFWSLIFFDVIVDNGECSDILNCKTYEVSMLLFILIQIVLINIIVFMKSSRPFYFDKLSEILLQSKLNIVYPSDRNLTSNEDPLTRFDSVDTDIELRTKSVNYNSDVSYFVNGRIKSINLDEISPSDTVFNELIRHQSENSHISSSNRDNISNSNNNSSSQRHLDLNSDIDISNYMNRTISVAYE